MLKIIWGIIYIQGLILNIMGQISNIVYCANVTCSYLSIVLVQMESLPRLGPVVSTIGSYM